VSQYVLIQGTQVKTTSSEIGKPEYNLAISQIAQWLLTNPIGGNGKPINYTTETPKVAANPATASLTAKQDVLISYALGVKDNPNLGTLPKLPFDQAKANASAAANAITSPLDFLKTLLSPALWLRVLEVGLGLLLIGVGVAKLSSGAAEQLQKVPLAGKLIP